MSVPLILVLVAPLAGAALAPAFGDVPVQRRALGVLCVAVALGGATWAVVRTVSGSGAAWRGFTVDPWRALLVFGAVLCSAAAVARVADGSRQGLTQAAVFAAIAAGLMPLVVSETHLLAVTLPVATAGIAVASFASAAEPGRALRAARAVAALAVSDALALVALGSALTRGTSLPPRLTTTAAALLLSAAAIRLGLTPVAGAAEDAQDAHGVMGALWLGPVRAQGFLLAVFAVGAHRGVAYTAAAVAALAILVAGVTSSDRDAGSSLAALGTAVAVLGFALGGATPTWGATLALVAAFAAPAAWSAGGAFSAGARASLTALPAGGLLAGSALVLGAAFAAGAVEPWFLAFAVPAAAGLAAAAGMVWRPREGPRTGGFARVFAGTLGVTACLAIAAVPERATTWLSVPIARTLGVGRLLSVGGTPGLAAGLAVIVLGAGVLAATAGPGRMGSGGPPGSGPARRLPLPLDWWARAAGAPARGSTIAAGRAAFIARRWAIAATVMFAVAVGLAARVWVAAAGRGFL